VIVILLVSMSSFTEGFDVPGYDLIQIIPYVIVLAGGIIGINVFVVLLLGIVSGFLIMLCTGAATATALLGGMGAGAAGMFETAMVAILVSAICALIREAGGFEALLAAIYNVFKGRKGGLLGMGILVVLLDIATANNTVAIVMANPIASDMAKNYGITPKKTASILDTFSCISQGILPYGAQMLVALSAASSLGCGLSAFRIIPLLFYPYLLLISSLVFIFVIPERKNEKA
jgi:Na+/H+ antiporter NhaC